MTTLICNCNRTLPLDTPALGRALGETLVEHSTLCRREAPAFQRALKDGSPEPLLVACTQERRLFTELAAQTEGAPSSELRPIRFVNLRETGGWGREGKQATPKMSALLALAQLPDPDPVPTVSFRSEGRLLVIGPLERAEALAARLDDALELTLFATGGAGRQERRHPVLAGQLQRLSGRLGAFELEWSANNPIALDLCTRCNACVDACPEGAIGLDYQIDLQACSGHRDCVRVCEAAGAIDFQRAPQSQRERFDLVLDLRETPAFSQHQKPQGYFHLPPRADAETQLAALLNLRDQVGEFEQPRFVNYQSRLCAHGRNGKTGCSACIDICSASAISSRSSGPDKARAQIHVDPHLCAGCGACSTVCPSGALSYSYPSLGHQGDKLRRLLSTYARAGGRDAVLLLHSDEAGSRLIDDWGRAARLDRSLNGVPARVLPWPLRHVASLGIEFWLSAVAQGASQVWLLTTDAEAPDYLRALREQLEVAQSLLTGLGYAGEHFRLLQARDARDIAALDAEAQAAPAQGVREPARFALQADKRATLEMALEHLQRQAPRSPLPSAIALPPAAPLGSVRVDADACTLCLSCVSACPAGALQDNPGQPQLRLIEKNCLQCGLCARTCPEQAITLEPRLLLDPSRRELRVVAEQPVFRCIRCSTPFGTERGIAAMIARLGAHPMFQGTAADRLKMCGDCRVIDIHTGAESRITDL